MMGLTVGCGRVSLQEPASDASPVDPPLVDARPSEPVVDATPGPQPAIDAAPPDPLDPTLIAWYPLDDASDGFTADATGNGRDAQCVPDPDSCPTLVEGRAGRAMAFAETWVHLAGSWDGFTKRFYVNGNLAYAFDEHFVDFDGSDFVIGGDENGGQPALMFGGRVDDVRIYARALEDDEIAALAAP